MNERILELYREAEKSVAFLSNSKESKQLIIQEKFAELIVRECAGVVADAVDHREPASTYASKITQHFGVRK